MNVTQLFKAHEKIEKKQIIFSNKKQCLFEAFQAAEIKKHQLCCHAQFFCNHDDKLIQENTKIFKEKLYVLKREQNFITFLNDNFSDLLIFEINVNVIFSALSDDF